MKTRMIMSVFIIILAAAMVGGATIAWFTDESPFSEAVFTAGTLEIDADGPGKEAEEVVISDWNPGDTTPIEYTIENSGTKGALLRVKLVAEWDNLDSTKLYTGSNPDAILDSMDWWLNQNVTFVLAASSDDWIFVATDENDVILVTPYAAGGWLEIGGLGTEQWFSGYWYYNGMLEANHDPLDSPVFALDVHLKGEETKNQYQGASFKIAATFEAIQASNRASDSAWGIVSTYDGSGTASDNWVNWGAPIN